MKTHSHSHLLSEKGTVTLHCLHICRQVIIIFDEYSLLHIAIGKMQKFRPKNYLYVVTNRWRKFLKFNKQIIVLSYISTPKAVSTQ